MRGRIGCLSVFLFPFIHRPTVHSDRSPVSVRRCPVPEAVPPGPGPSDCRPPRRNNTSRGRIFSSSRHPKPVTSLFRERGTDRTGWHHVGRVLDPLTFAAEYSHLGKTDQHVVFRQIIPTGDTEPENSRN